MAQAFTRHFQYNIDIVPDRLSLTKIENKPNKSFREYGFRWREQAARVNHPMEEDEMLEYFLQVLEPIYFGHLISAIGEPFNGVVKIGEMVEEGLKSSKIMSYSAIKETMQEIQNDIGSLLGKKKKDDVAMVVSGPWRGPRGLPHQYTQSRPQPRAYTQAPYNPSHHNTLNTQSGHPNTMFTMHNHMLNPLLTRNGVHQLHKTLIHTHNPAETLLVQNFDLGLSIKEKGSSRKRPSPLWESPMPVCFKG
nr:uncharacterized protein LOC117275072 [Nicotiana tomentosiformis]